MKKGFTLIELLAVIIMLAVIALIATPAVLDIVNNTKETSRQSSIVKYADATRVAIYEDQFKHGGTMPNVDKTWVSNNVTIDGEQVNCEEVHFSDTFGVILHRCNVGSNEKKYCHASGKTYEDCDDAEYKSIYDSLSNVEVVEKDLAEELKKQYNESNTTGLLKDEEGYYYKGTNEEVANNFVWFGGHLWRVVSIDNNDNIIMITQQPITILYPIKSAWRTQTAYEESYINHWLNDTTDGIFLKSMDEDDNSKIITSVFNIGAYTNVSELTTTQKVGLLDETQYTKAGGQNSYLDIKDSWWLGDTDQNPSTYVRFVYEDGSMNTTNQGSDRGVRPVVKISNLTIIKGEGTLDNPYRESSTTTNTANIKVGEYVSVPTTGADCGTDNKCLFRVVSKDNNSIKVTLNGLLPSTRATTVTYTSGSAIDNIVTTFANTISNTYRYNGTDKTFGVGVYAYHESYITVQNAKYTGNVGLPVVGEMFTGNDIDITYPLDALKTFINVATIENPTASSWYWTMNAFSTSSVHCVASTGSLCNTTPSNVYGIRPVLFLNNNLTFTGGEGTAENPFTLE